MKQIYPDLWQTKLDKPFGGVFTHAYVLAAESGNVLIYNTKHLDELDEIEQLGGIRYQVLSHRDEVGESLAEVKNRFVSKLCCHVDEVPAVSKVCSPDVEFESANEEIYGLKVIHTPGHTSGSMSYLYDSPHGKTYLFTGDCLFCTHGDWGTFPISSMGGRVEDLIASLNFYRSLNPDVAIWSASGGGDAAYSEVSDNEWSTILDGVISKLNKKEN